MKTFCFTVDDNIRVFRELTENTYASLFDHPYLSMYKRLHEQFDLKVQLNLFYRTDGFELSQTPYHDEWAANADWLKLSFHADVENERPYEHAGYDEVYCDCERVQQQIARFASLKALAKTTTVHYCQTTPAGLKALADNGVTGLLGLFGDEQHPRTSYGLPKADAAKARGGEVVTRDGMHFAAIDIVLNLFTITDILARLRRLLWRDSVRVMIHEQYFYEDYERYQSDFEEKLRATFSCLREAGFESRFFEEI